MAELKRDSDETPRSLRSILDSLPVLRPRRKRPKSTTASAAHAVDVVDLTGSSPSSSSSLPSPTERFVSTRYNSDKDGKKRKQEGEDGDDEVVITHVRRVKKPRCSGPDTTTAFEPPPSPPPSSPSLGNTRTCNICFEDGLPVEFLATPTARCAHDATVCRECLRRYIAASVDGNTYLHMRCLFDGCNEELDAHDIQQLASEEVRQRYETLITRSALSALPDFHWCLSPDCTSGQFHDGDAQMTCEACGFSTCVAHRTPWHSGRTCEQVNAERGGGISASRVRDETLHRRGLETLKMQDCPGCGVTVQRTSGCNIMTCVCRHRFCYGCGVSLGRGRWRHRASCRTASRGW